MWFDNEDLDMHTEGFRNTLEQAPQNDLNLLLPAVTYDPNPADGDYFDANYLKPSNPQRKASFNAPTPDKKIATEKRVGFYYAYDDSAWIEKLSELHGMNNPTSDIMVSLEAGRQRFRQDEILQAFDGPGYKYRVDKSGNLISRAPIEVAYPNRLIIPVDFYGHHEDETVATEGEAQGYTYGKVNRARTMLNKSKIIGGKKFLICDQDGLEVMLNKKLMTSRDYEKAEKIKEDGVGFLLGFNWIVLPDDMPEVDDGVRKYFAVNNRAVHYKTRTEVDAQINKRPDRSNALQAYYAEEHGAARMLDDGVITIHVDLNA